MEREGKGMKKSEFVQREKIGIGVFGVGGRGKVEGGLGWKW